MEYQQVRKIISRIQTTLDEKGVLALYLRQPTLTQNIKRGHHFSSKFIVFPTSGSHRNDHFQSLISVIIATS